ncbi:polymer-forming cytoskeletal protein [candidate division WOR-3 bacterium]|nr:polymer-forming cytoskeletal protein [candidate division WOR-3 bacterium]
MLGKNSRGDSKIETVIGQTSFLEGTVSSENSLRIDGKIEGKINGNQDIIIGESGYVKGTIKGENLIIAGILEGTADINGTLSIKKSATILGDIVVGAIDIEEGGKFLGSCKMKNEPKLLESSRIFEEKKKREPTEDSDSGQKNTD